MPIKSDLTWIKFIFHRAASDDCSVLAYEAHRHWTATDSTKPSKVTHPATNESSARRRVRRSLR